MEYYCFADLTLDSERRELRRGSTPIGMQPQVFDLLLYLVRNRDRVVSRDDLIASVWGGRIVSESALASRINAVRKAVGDSGQAQTLIRTFPRKGVRFIGAVREQPTVNEPARAGASALNARTGPRAPLPAVDGRARRSKARKLSWVLGSGIVTATAALVLFQFAPPAGTATGQRPGVEGGEAIPSATAAVAVLPFANLSSDSEQEFFSDGMTNEITAALARVPGLRVVGRSSAFQFKGQNRDLRAIGRSLGAAYLIDGTVRKEGDRVRITAQLVQAENGVSLWTESYDRQLAGVFATQEEIARAIVGALRVPMVSQPGKRLVSNRSTDPEAYEQYLRAKAHLRAYRSRPGDPVAMLEQAVARDPGYAPAWALLAVAHASGLFNLSSSFDVPIQESRRIVSTVLSQAEAAARQAIVLDKDLGDGYASLAYIQGRRGRHLLAEDLYLEALRLDRDNPETLHNYSSLLAGVGRLKDAVAMKRRLLVLEPFVPVYNQIAAWVLWSGGETDAAIAIFKAMNRVDRGPLLGAVFASLGWYSEAIDEFSSPNSSSARVLRTAPAKADSPETLPRLDLTAFAYLYVGASHRFLEPIERQVDAGYVDSDRNTEVWHPSPLYSAVRKTERFKAFARNAGLVEYWHAKGWPDFCRPVGSDDFVCD